MFATEPVSNILVLGGRGFVGSSLCARLIERSGGGNGPIAVPTRRPSRARHLQLLPTVDVVPADLHDDAQLARLVAGRDAVINLVGVLHGNEAAFRRAHVELPQRVAGACVAAGVRRIVHVSALGTDPAAPSRYLRSKAAGESALRGIAPHATVLRPSVMFGEHDHFLNLFARLQAVFPVVPLAAADARFQPVWVEDVACAIVATLDDPSTAGLTIECTGPEVFTLKELVQLAGRWSGHRRPVMALPGVLARLQATLMEWLPGEPLLSRDNLDSMKHPSVATGKLPGLERLGIAATSIHNVMPEVLSPRGGLARLEVWRALSHRG